MKNTVGSAFAAKRVRAIHRRGVVAVLNDRHRASVDSPLSCMVQIKVTSGRSISVGVWDTGAHTSTARM